MKHSDKDVRGFLKEIRRIGWEIEERPNSNLIWGFIACGSGCRHKVLCTPKGSAGSQAKILRERVEKCPHGKSIPVPR